MLAQVARQILHRLIKLKEFPDAPVAQIQSRIFELPLTRVFRIFPFPTVDQSRQTTESFIIKSEHLADLTRGRTPAISNHVRRHRRAQLSIALINILNCPLALIAARQIEIDVRPLAPLFR